MTSFFVPGIPQPGGSKRGFVVNGRAVITEDAKKSKPWRAVVALAARDAMAGAPPMDAPLRLVVVFVLPRPKGHFGRRGLLPSARPWPSTKPDTTKLLRALEDACTGIVWRDDTQVVQQLAWKVYGPIPGAAVSIALPDGSIADPAIASALGAIPRPEAA